MFNLSSANAFNLVTSKLLLIGKVLRLECRSNVENIVREKVKKLGTSILTFSLTLFKAFFLSQNLIKGQIISLCLMYYYFQGFVIFVTMCREALDDFRRYRRDKEANSQRYKIFTNSGIISVPSSSIRVGDLVCIEKVKHSTA